MILFLNTSVLSSWFWVKYSNFCWRGLLLLSILFCVVHLFLIFPIICDAWVRTLINREIKSLKCKHFDICGVKGGLVLAVLWFRCIAHILIFYCLQEYFVWWQWRVDKPTEWCYEVESTWERPCLKTERWLLTLECWNLNASEACEHLGHNVSTP